MEDWYGGSVGRMTTVAAEDWGRGSAAAPGGVLSLAQEGWSWEAKGEDQGL